MSTKHPDVIAAPPSDMTALTLAEMHQLKWIVLEQCARCGLGLKVSLPGLIMLHGPDAPWWGRKRPCPNLRCEGGEMVYSAQSVRGGSVKPLKGPPSDLAIERWRRSRGIYPGPR